MSRDDVNLLIAILSLIVAVISVIQGIKDPDRAAKRAKRLGYKALRSLYFLIPAVGLIAIARDPAPVTRLTVVAGALMAVLLGMGFALFLFRQLVRALVDSAEFDHDHADLTIKLGKLVGDNRQVLTATNDVLDATDALLKTYPNLTKRPDFRGKLI